MRLRFPSLLAVTICASVSVLSFCPAAKSDAQSDIKALVILVNNMETDAWWTRNMTLKS